MQQRGVQRSIGSLRSAVVATQLSRIWRASLRCAARSLRAQLPQHLFATGGFPPPLVLVVAEVTDLARAVWLLGYFGEPPQPRARRLLRRELLCKVQSWCGDTFTKTQAQR